jgi:hypothetical protein
VYRGKDKNWSLAFGWTYRWLADLCSVVTKFFFAVIFVACLLYTPLIFLHSQGFLYLFTPFTIFESSRPFLCFQIFQYFAFFFCFDICLWFFVSFSLRAFWSRVARHCGVEFCFRVVLISICPL